MNLFKKWPNRLIFTPTPFYMGGWSPLLLLVAAGGSTLEKVTQRVSASESSGIVRHEYY